MSFFDSLIFAYYATKLPEFFEKVGESAVVVGEKIADKCNESNEKFNEYSMRCSNWSDEKLIRKMKECIDPIEKMAYMQELKNRGYSSKGSEE